jgi:hypothetical protein
LRSLQRTSSQWRPGGTPPGGTGAPSTVTVCRPLPRTPSTHRVDRRRHRRRQPVVAPVLHVAGEGAVRALEGNAMLHRARHLEIGVLRSGSGRVARAPRDRDRVREERGVHEPRDPEERERGGQAQRERERSPTARIREAGGGGRRLGGAVRHEGRVYHVAPPGSPRAWRRPPPGDAAHERRALRSLRRGHAGKVAPLR